MPIFLNPDSLKSARKILFLFCLIFALELLFPQFTIYAETINHGSGPVKLAWINHPDNPKVAGAYTQSVDPSAANYSASESRPFRSVYVTATAYSSRIEECDNDPYTAAWGDHVYWGMIASNSFPRNTKIQIPELYGDKIFAVKDRMNDRYSSRIDLWMPDTKDAKQFGVKYVKINILD